MEEDGGFERHHDEAQNPDEGHEEEMGGSSPYYNQRETHKEGSSSSAKDSAPMSSKPHHSERRDSRRSSDGQDQSYFTPSRGPVRGRDGRPPAPPQSGRRYEPYPADNHRAHTQSVSKVLHFRNLPNGFSLRDLQETCHPFGKVLFISPIKSKGQALVEFIDVNAAVYFNDHHPSGFCYLTSARDQKVYFDYSKHRELLHKANEPNRIIYVTFQSRLPLDFLTPDHVFQMFGASRYGFIEKILMVQDKKDRPRDASMSSSSSSTDIDVQDQIEVHEERQYKSRSVLVQFASVSDALSAVARLNGETFLIDDIGVFTMIQYSAIQSLIVPHGQEGRDYVSQRHPSPHLPPLFPVVRPFSQAPPRSYRQGPPSHHPHP